MSAVTATFNGVTLGDGYKEVSVGNLTRAGIADEVLGRAGVVVRDRGGWRQTLTITIFKEFTNLYDRLGYAETLLAAMGGALASLVVNTMDGARTWTNCLPTEVAEQDPFAHNAIILRLTFVRGVTLS